jgi:spermidine synthase
MAGQYLNIPIRSDRLAQTVFIKNRLYHRRTRFQTIEIFDTEVFGKVLTLDGHIQLTEFDEFAYHEALVQIPLLSLEAPKRALVVGGGDGGVIREICKLKEIEHVDMVEIDEGVIEACVKWLPNVSGGAFQDPRVKVHVGDAFLFVNQVSEPYDLIVVDSTDTYEEEDGALSEQLFTKEFYSDCKKLLTPNGVVVTQSDNLVFCPYSMANVLSLLRSVFPVTGRYHALVPSFGGFSGFCWASTGGKVKNDWSELRADRVQLSYLNEVLLNYGNTPLPFC